MVGPTVAAELGLWAIWDCQKFWPPKYFFLLILLYIHNFLFNFHLSCLKYGIFLEQKRITQQDITWLELFENWCPFGLHNYKTNGEKITSIRNIVLFWQMFLVIPVCFIKHRNYQKRAFALKNTFFDWSNVTKSMGTKTMNLRTKKQNTEFHTWISQFSAHPVEGWMLSIPWSRCSLCSLSLEPATDQSAICSIEGNLWEQVWATSSEPQGVGFCHKIKVTVMLTLNI